MLPVTIERELVPEGVFGVRGERRVASPSLFSAPSAFSTLTCVCHRHLHSLVTWPDVHGVSPPFAGADSCGLPRGALRPDGSGQGVPLLGVHPDRRLQKSGEKLSEILRLTVRFVRTVRKDAILTGKNGTTVYEVYKTM